MGQLTSPDTRFASRIYLLLTFRWRPAEVRLGLDHPFWFDDPSLDLNFHARQRALRAPGDDYRLAEQSAHIVSRRPDSSRPLSELDRIHGLNGGRVAILAKLHAAADAWSLAAALREALAGLLALATDYATA